MLEAGVFVLLLLLGYGFGRSAELRHLRRLVEREREMNRLPAIASRFPPEDRPYAQALVGGSVVIASDYFKSFVAGLINIFGGRVTPFESLIDRARREALLRMKEQALARGAVYVFNVKFETSRIAVGRVGAMEVLAYGTALMPLDGGAGAPVAAIGASGTGADAARPAPERIPGAASAALTVTARR